MTHIQDMQVAVAAWTRRKGWRGDGAPSRTFGDDIALLHSEVSEALEAFRDYGMTDTFRNVRTGEYEADFEEPDGTLNKPEGVGSELADLLIRLLDCAQHYDIDLDHEFHQKMRYNETREHRHGGKNL